MPVAESRFTLVHLGRGMGGNADEMRGKSKREATTRAGTGIFFGIRFSVGGVCVEELCSKAQIYAEKSRRRERSNRRSFDCAPHRGVSLRMTGTCAGHQYARAYASISSFNSRFA